MAVPAQVQFNLKHFEQITASMINWLSSMQALTTDFNIGSVTRTLLEASAMELEELYYRLFAGIQASIPEECFIAFGFSAVSASPATATVTFGRTVADPFNSYQIPAGTMVSTADGVSFQTVAAVTLLLNTTSITAAAVAVVSGVSGNVAAGSITVMNSAVVGVQTVTNSAPSTGGVDQESPSAQQVRFTQYVAALARSPINGIVAGALTAQLVDGVSGLVTERVLFASLVEPYRTDATQPVGVCNLYIDNGGGSASGSLVTQTQQIIDGYIDPVLGPIMGYRAAGVTINVSTVQTVSQSLTATVTPKSGVSFSTVQAAAQAAAGSAFNALGIGQTLRWSQLLAAIMSVPGVQAATIAVPAGDVTCLASQRLRLGAVTITQGI
ncbi:MAG: baseplate J/gp47 family protein [Nitrospirota bacterium]|nr:baseplate J/gp47 family protein [Nitrospirota bacterium]